MSKKRLLPLVILGLVVVAGCPGDTAPPPEVPSIPDTSLSPEEELKSQLEGLAQDGLEMPGMETLGDTIQSIKASDPEKGAALEKDWEEMEGLLGGDPEEVKAKAKAMLEKM